MSTIQVDRIIPYQSASVQIDSLSVPNLATTGSNTFTGNQNIQGTITASIAQGFALVGGVGNISTLVATSSFGGALPEGVVSGSSQISSLGFATTGSNTFVGNQTITGSLIISGSESTDLLVQGRMLISGLTTGVDTPQLIISGSDSINTVGRSSMVINVTTGSVNAVINATSGSGVNLGNQTNCLITSTQISSLETSTSGSYKRISISSNPSKMGVTALSAITQPSLLGLNNSATIYQVLELQSQGNFTDGTVSFKVPVAVTGSVDVLGLSKQTLGAAGTESQKDIIVVTGSVIDGKSFTNVVFGLQDYPSFGDNFKDAFVFDYWDSQAYNFGASYQHNGLRTGTELLASGSGNSFGGAGYGINQLRAVGNKSFLNQYASIINIGAYAPSTTDSITIGHSTLPVLSLASLKNEISGSTIISGSGGLQVTGSISVAPTHQVRFATGSNQQAATAVLDGANPGAVVVSNSLVTANSIILLTKQTLAHSNGYVAVSAKSGGSFTITSNHNGDTDTVGYFIINNS